MCRHNFGDDITHNCQDIEENICFSNGGTNLHIHAIAQGRPEDNQVEFLQGPHGIVNPPKNLILNNIRGFTQMANGLHVDIKKERRENTPLFDSIRRCKKIRVGIPPTIYIQYML